jgi:hypothetical protein
MIEVEVNHSKRRNMNESTLEVWGYYERSSPDLFDVHVCKMCRKNGIVKVISCFNFLIFN